MLLIALMLPLPAAAQQQGRIALIITNQNYSLKELKLSNTYADGELLKAALEAVGFTVTLVRDTADRDQLELAIGEHVTRLATAGPDAIGFFYYSGHGAAAGPGGPNYLIPTKANITHAAQLRLSALSVERITDALAGAGGKMSFVVFDACRNVPLQRADKSNFKGFAPVREERGLLIAYATEAGNVAVDESLYARALAEEIVKPGQEAGSVFRAVTRKVAQETQDRQNPEMLDRRRYDFVFKAGPQVAVGISEDRRPAPAPAACEGVDVSLGAGGRQCVKPGSGESFRDCSDCPEMVVAPAGDFVMGSPENEPERDSDESPQHKVTIKQPFAVGKYAVTFDEWNACADAGGCKGYKPPDQGWGGRDRPVINVSWDDAQLYVTWLSKKTGKPYRLLSEAERESVARAGTTTPFWWGSSIKPDQANYDGTNVYKGGGEKGEDRQKTLPVKSFQPNPWGLYQVHGNVWDWVQDCWNDSYKGAPADGSAWTSGDCIRRVLRGGSWNDSPRNLRAADRYWTFPSVTRCYYCGFRLARTLNP